MPSDEEVDAAYAAHWKAPAYSAVTLRERLRAALEAAEAVRTPHWEYGVTTKWGPYAFFTKEAAEEYVVALRASIADGRESGDLTHHGKLLRRRQRSDFGPWEPVPEEETHAQ